MENENTEWLEWLATAMTIRPKGNKYLDSQRGIEVAKLMIDNEREAFNWRRSDVDTFWVDVQMAVKYKLDDDEIGFIQRTQMGLDNWKHYVDERKAYAEMVRGLEKLRIYNAMKQPENMGKSFDQLKQEIGGDKESYAT